MSDPEHDHSRASSEMNPPGPKRLRELFLQSAEIEDPAARAAFLSRACGDDAVLRQRVEELLAAEQAAGPAPAPQPGASTPASFLAAQLTEQPGEMIGRYKLREKLGEGGCGVVYMAEQEEPVRRKVALKIIKLGMDTRSVIARFEAERQALALMDHPNIARVLDAGATETGRPYFVMELVGGIKITDYCEKNNLTIRQRLDLFIQVCHAVQHAHQKGVIHRDIKPSNVLVAEQDGVAVPKVIDFGIAKATEGKLTDQTVFTAFEQFLGTPAYMSPEQAQVGGLDVDTRSDIYSLGVLLYELLTRKTPFDAKELLAVGLEAMRRTICEKEPPTPSTRLTQERLAHGASSSGKSEIGNDNSEIDRDLDWIVMKCLEKDRARRYETANGLARDIGRHLNNEPVAAGPPGAAYKLGKFVRRNRTAVVVAASITAVLVLGIATSIREARQQSRLRQQAQAAQAREERERKKAQTEAAKSQHVAKFLEEMLQGVGPSVALGRDTTMLREILDKTSDRMGQELSNQPEVAAQLTSTIGKLQMDLGEFGKAEATLRAAVALRRKVPGDDLPDVAMLLNELAFVLRAQDKLPEAEATVREALDILSTPAGKEDVRTASSLCVLAELLRCRGKLPEAETVSRKAVEIDRRLLGRGHPDLSFPLHILGNVLFSQGKFVEAETLFREALETDRKVWTNGHPDIASSLIGLGETLISNGKATEAETVLREALAMNRKLHGEEHPEVALALGALADALSKQGKLAETETIDRQVLALRRKLLGNEHHDVAVALNNLSLTLQRQGKTGEAEAVLREALGLLRKRGGNEDPEVAMALYSLGRLLLEQGNLTEAETAYSEALAIRRKVLGNEHPDVTASLNDLGFILHLQHKDTEAEPLCQEQLQRVRAQAPADPVALTRATGLLAETLVAQNKFIDAEAPARECLTIRELSIGDDWRTFAARFLLGCSLLGQKRYAEAESLLLSGYVGMKQREEKIPSIGRMRIRVAVQHLVKLYEVAERPEQAAEWNKRLVEFEEGQTNAVGALPKPPP